jgi:hypothetical protein
LNGIHDTFLYDDWAPFAMFVFVQLPDQHRDIALRFGTV